MPRTVEITAPAAQTDQIVGKLRQLDGVVSLRVQRGISIQPPGDVITVATTNRALHPMMRALDQQGLVHNSAGSITTTQPTSLVSQPLADQIMNDVSEATWEEMEATIARESNMTVNGLVMMALAGVLAVVGLATNALHIVIAAMLIAPGFEPIVRIGLGIVARSRTLKLGISQTALAYLALVAGAAATTVVLRVIGKGPLGDESSYLPADVLIPYWTSLSAPSLLVSAAASLAGTLVIAISTVRYSPPV
jgi:hypothetical protein